MAIDDPVVKALRAALQTNNSIELRIALGKHYFGQSYPNEALAEFEAALTITPTNTEALRGAIDSAYLIGDENRAKAYELAINANEPGLISEAVRPVDQGNQTCIPNAEPSQINLNKRKANTPKLRLILPGDKDNQEDGPTSIIRFEDVGGMETVKQRLSRSFLMPLQNPELHKKFGKRIQGGMVLYGPPGCGKTFLARALAGEIGARFMNVGLSEILDMWFGESEKRLHEFFENARRRAPTLLFFDEVDAIGQRRTQLKGSAGRTLVNQFLSEMDGFGGRNEGVFVLGATNHPWDLDPALRRPGRFDRLFFVPSPDIEARRKIFELKLKDRPVEILDFGKAARLADGYSGADIEAVVDIAAELAIDASVKSGREESICDVMLARALREVKPSTRPWFETARNYVLYANEGGVYDDLLEHLRVLGLV